MNDDLSELRARYERLQLLYDVSNVIRSSLDPQEAMNLIVAQAVRVTQASSGSVVLVNPTTLLLEIHASHGLPPDASRLRLRVGEGITGWVAEFGKPALIGDVRSDPRYVEARANVRSELAVPLEVRGEVHGVLNVDSDRENAFSEQDQALLIELAGQAAKVIHDTWLYAQLGLKARLFEALIKVSQTINTTLNLDEALDVITRQAALLMEAKLCSLLLADPEKQWLDLRACHGGGVAYREKPRLSVTESLIGVVLRRAKPLQVENVQKSSRYQEAGIAHREGLVSLLSVPLVYDNDAIGVLNIYRGEPYCFSNEEIHILSALAELSAVAIRKARLYEKVLEAEEALRQNEKLSALGLLAAEVAHEIRNPLTVMKMLYHSLDLRFPDNDPRQKDAEIVREKMDHLNRIVEQILAFARSAEPNLESVDLNRVLNDLSILLRHKLSQQSVEAVLNLAPTLPSIDADKVQMEQVFLNLSLNAIQAMPKGGWLVIRTRSEPEWAVVEFEDNGHGMTQEESRNAFDSFLQSNKPGGTGLGLAVVKRVLDAHRATIAIDSTPGKGTRVTLRFPR
ncbi:MAG: GAF domain-containing protein [Verrucomicrobia bacterium]|nr:GAF domain-containing protein [Verrucomicrobiota bacterium]MBI3867606.1 GAF domain-containing protein [Verrucomicrobiota bacterium]